MQTVTFYLGMLYHKSPTKYCPPVHGLPKWTIPKILFWMHTCTDCSISL